MNIGIVALVLNPKSGARAPIELALALSPQNRVSFYALETNSDPGSIKALKENGVKIVLLPKSALGPFKLLTLLKRQGHQVLSTHTNFTFSLAAYFSKIPVVNTYYGTQFDVANERFLKENLPIKFINKILNVIIFIKSLIIVWFSKKSVAISKYTQRQLESLYGRKSLLIYLGSSHSLFKKMKLPDLTVGVSSPRCFVGSEIPPKQKLLRIHPRAYARGFLRRGIKPGRRKKQKTLNLLSVSRITPYKGFEKIVSIVKALPDEPSVNLTIVGSSPQRNYLEYLDKIKSAKTKILLNIRDERLLDLYKNSDIYLTADKYLFFGMPILEAATFGKASISFDFAAASEIIIHGKTGFVAKNTQEFKKYLEVLIKNKKIRLRMGREAKKRALKVFSWEHTAKKYQEVFQSIMKFSAD